jgi:hypothetical protein
MLSEHRELKPHKEAIKKAINSGSESEVKDMLNQHGKIIIEKLNMRP